MKLLISFFLFCIAPFISFSQTGCRRITTGIAYTTVLLDGSYNFNGPAFDASTMCLAPSNPGVPCTIRIPFTLTTYPGILGNYSIVNCGIDNGHLMFATLTFAAVYLLRKCNGTGRKQKKTVGDNIANYP